MDEVTCYTQCRPISPQPIPSPIPSPFPMPIPIPTPTPTFPPRSRCCVYNENNGGQKCLRLLVEKCPNVNGLTLRSEFPVESIPVCTNYCERKQVNSIKH
jgi:hypothetical protein